MPTKSHDLHKQIAARMKAKNISIYKLAKDMNQERTNLRRTLQSDMQISTFIAIVKELGGTVNITWND